jgi:phenylacetate-CoA ligase
MGLKDIIYKYSPYYLQDLFCSMEGYRIKRLRYKSSFFKQLDLYLKMQTKTDDEILQFRDNSISKFVKYAFENIPFYSELYSNYGVNINQIQTLNDLKNLPIVEKNIVKENVRKISNYNCGGKIVMAHTSGTTGGGLIFPMTQYSVQAQWAIWWRYRLNFGINLETWCGYFGGRPIVPISNNNPPFYRVNKPGKQIMFSQYHLSEKTFRFYVNSLNQYKPKWLHGYPSFITNLSQLMIDNNVKLNYQIDIITTGAENLLEFQKISINTAFGVWPIQHYGMSEGVANISMHTDNQLYVDEDFSGVEFEKSEVNSSYSILGTNFTNLAFPLIRYRVGDLADIDTENQNGIRIVKGIDGRNEDFIVLTDGSKVGRLDHLLKDCTKVVEAQIIQNEIGKIVLNLVVNKSYNSKDEKFVYDQVNLFLGDKIEVKIVYLTNIPKTNSGKLKFVISNVK